MYVRKYVYFRYAVRNFKLSEASHGAGAKSVTVKPTGCGFDPARGNKIFI